MNSRRSGTKVQ